MDKKQPTKPRTIEDLARAYADRYAGYDMRVWDACINAYTVGYEAALKHIKEKNKNG